MRRAMRILIPFLLLASLAAGGEPEVIALWPGVPPGSENATGEEEWVDRTETVLDRAVKNVHRPTLTVYLPDEGQATGAGILVAPGGAYRHLAIDKEGHDVARWLASKGVAGFVLKYRLPRTEGHDYSVETAVADAERGLALIREHAERWGVSPDRIGMMGFSAGGNLAIRAGLDLDQPPNFLAPIYPSVPEELAVATNTPPSFLVHAHDDGLTSENSIRFYLALKEKGVSAELHIYSEGGHGFGIRQRGLPVSHWGDRFFDWLRVQGLLTAKKPSGS